MAIVAGDIKIYFSGGSGNTDPNQSLGGAISTTEMTNNSLHNLFDEVSGSESLPGDIEYRGIYVKNTHGSLTAKATKVYISQASTSASSEIDIALAGEGLNATIETIANEGTAPAGETFSRPTTYSGGLSMGDIPTGQRYGLWIRRTIDAAASAATPDEARFKVDCDTDA